MLPMNGTNRSKKRMNRSVTCFLGSLALAGAVGAAQPDTAAATAHPQHAAASPTTYRVINLGSGTLPTTPAINASDQVAFTLANESGTARAWFYDGTAAADIGTLGGAGSFAPALNDAGQVAGFSNLGGDQVNHAYVWSKRSGMVDLGTLTGVASSFATAINNRGQVVGSSGFGTTAHAFRWSAADGMEDLGAGPFIYTDARAINDAGLVAGTGITANFEPQAFAWSRKNGLVDLGTLGGPGSDVVGIGADGQVAGNSALPNSLGRAYVWTRGKGMQDLGTAGGLQSVSRAMSANGHVVGVILNPIPNGTTSYGFSWTRATGMVNIGTLGGAASTALGVNNKGQVVGWSDTSDGQFHAVVWTAKEGMIDLNKRLRHAPPGIVLFTAQAISDNGAIVATSNAGLVLLKSGRGDKCTHAVGPIAAADLVQVGAPFDASVSFAGEDKAAQHNVIWSWGDGSGDRAGNVRESNAVGSASGNHTYTTPGIYTVTANLVDLAGNSAAVSREIIAYDPSRGVVGGNGWFMSPRGANRQERSQAGDAKFSFVLPSRASAKATSTKALLQFNVGTLSFRSENVRPVAVQGARGQFEGTGTINGAGDYKFTLATTAGEAVGRGKPGRFGLRIWHIDPATRAEVVDYDNLSAGRGVVGHPIIQGTIAVQ
jgi:probable HAF family extracellular repeat protein